MSGETSTTRPTTEAEHLANAVHHAHNSGMTLDGTALGRSLDLEGAYAVQAQLTALRIADGRKPAGYKLGYTSAIMRRQMGVSSPNYGVLYEDMIVPSGASVEGLLQPRVEPEVAVVLGRELAGRDLLMPDVAAAISELRVSLELVDSVWHGYRFTAEQNTADGSSAAGVVLGPPLDLHPLDCHRVTVELTIDGWAVASATGAAAGGHPLLGVAWLCRQLAEREGSGLAEGDVVITGGLTAAVPLGVGSRICATFNGTTDVTVARSSA